MVAKYGLQEIKSRQSYSIELDAEVYEKFLRENGYSEEYIAREKEYLIRYKEIMGIKEPEVVDFDTMSASDQFMAAVLRRRQRRKPIDDEED